MEEKKPKIFSLATTYPESSNSSKPKFVHALNKELIKDGYDIEVICPHSQGTPKNTILDSASVRFFRYLPQKYEIKSSIPDEIKTKAGKLKFLMMCIGFFFFTLGRCSKEKKFILHGHWAFPAGYVAYLISKLYKSKFIVTVHGSDVPLLKKYPFLKKIVVKSLNKSFGVIVSNNYLKDNLISIGVNKEKIELIKPIPNLTKIPSDEILDDFKKQMKISNKKIILFVGRLTEVKGTEFLIKAIPLLATKNIHLIIVGDGILLEKLKRITHSLEIEDKVTFFGSANSEELSKLYGISDLFVLPSIIDTKGGTEGTGLVILEAMAAGIPVISSNVGGIKETIQDEVNGLLVKEKDSHSLATAIDRVFSNQSLKDKIVKNSKSTVQEFSPEKISKLYEKLFEKMLQN